MPINEIDIDLVSSPIITEIVINVGGVSGGGGTVSETPPVDPAINDGWFDPEFGVFAIWDGEVWVGQNALPVGVVIPDGALTFGGDTLTLDGDTLTFTA